MDDVVFFDSSRTLGRSLYSADGSREVEFEPYGEAATHLADLTGRARIGYLRFGTPVFAPAGAQRAVAPSRLSAMVDASLVEDLDASGVEAPAGQTPPPFAALASRAGVAPERCVFVSRDPVRRRAALDAGFRVAPAAKHVAAVLAGERLTYVRLRPPSPDTPILPLLSIPGLDLLELGTAVPVLFGLATDSAKARVAAAGFAVDDLMSPEQSAVTTLFLIRDGLDPAFVRRVRRELAFVEETPMGLIVGIPPDRRIGEFHPERSAHGHTLRIPFAVPPPPPSPAPMADTLGPASTTGTPCNPPSLPVGTLPPALVPVFSELDAAMVTQFLDPLVGAMPLKVAASVTITSRAVDNQVANQAAVEHLTNELKDILGSADTHPFACDVGERFNVHAQITGSSCPKSLVIIGAHLDSTAVDTSGWKRATDDAPGADDDASGVAGVLAAAKLLAKLGPPKRTIRFVLFNAEEIGLLGSAAYAEDINDLGMEHVVAMLQMDMIGHRNAAVSQRRIELHPPGSSDFWSVWPQIITRSQALAGVVGTVAAAVSPQLVVQPYPVPPCTSDPVALRSDHASFVARQMTACMLSEEMFGDACATAHQSHAHPGYHTVNDTSAIIDPSYVADIARAVAAAAWVVANG